MPPIDNPDVRSLEHAEDAQARRLCERASEPEYERARSDGKREQRTWLFTGNWA